MPSAMVPPQNPGLSGSGDGKHFLAPISVSLLFGALKPETG